MIRTDAEYEAALKLVARNRDYEAKLRSALQERGLSEEGIERCMEPSITFHLSLTEDVERYENVRRRIFTPFRGFGHLGLLLIELRIAKGWSQSDLAEKLGVSEEQVSRDEYNDYHGITLNRAQRILDVLGESVITMVDDASVPDLEHRELVEAAR
jgi:DNA-binding XRE family transcriptional regulator